MAAFFSDLYVWVTDIWGQIIAGIFGRKARRAGRQLICVSEDGVKLSWVDAAEPWALSDLAARLKGIETQRKGRTGECVLRLENGRGLVRRLSDIALPASRLRAAAFLDLESATPFHQSDAHGLTLRAPSDGGSSYAIVKRAILDPVIDSCSAAGLKIGRIDIVNGEQVHCVSADSLRRLTGGAGKPGRGLAPALLIIIAGAGTLAHVAVKFDAAIQQIEESAGQLADEAKAVRGAMDQRAARIAEIEGLRKNIEERKLAGVIWEELARVLPDSSFLTDLSIKDSTVSISGYSAAASSIIVALEGSDMFDQASFTAPVVKVPGNAGDRFAIDLKMDAK